MWDQVRQAQVRTRVQLLGIDTVRCTKLSLAGALAVALCAAVPVREARATAGPIRTPQHSDTTFTRSAARIRLVAGAAGSGLALADARGRPRVLLGTTRHGPGLAVCDPGGAARGWVGFRGGGIGFGLWNCRELPQAAGALSLTIARFAVHGRQGAPRTALVLTGRRYAAAFFAQHGELRVASALGDFFPVIARFDAGGRIVREPFHHVLPGLFVDALKASLGFLARFARGDESEQAEPVEAHGEVGGRG
jgi:hypothetical protein